nr:hypothetical protein [Burkholderia sp. Ac-20384]
MVSACVRARGAARIARRTVEATRRADQGRARQSGAARTVSVAVPAQRGAIRDANAHAYAWRIAAGSDGLSAAASSRDPQALSTTVTLAAHCAEGGRAACGEAGRGFVACRCA